MLQRDTYIKLLEKRASTVDGGAIGTDYNYNIDNAAVANSDHDKNLSDNRSTLGSLFSRMGEAQKVETRFAKKWFPAEKFTKDTSAPLLKIAMNTLAASSAFRDYPPHYQAVAIRSFSEELEKIAEARR